MKRIFTISLIALIFSATNVHAQSKIGIRVGLSSYSWKGDAVSTLTDLAEFTNGYVTHTGRTGFFAGAYADLPLSEMISVQPGIYYSQKGFTLKGDLQMDKLDFLGASARAQMQSHYIDIPVLLTANLGEGFKLFAGPQLSYLAASNLNVRAGALGFKVLNRNMDLTEQFNRYDFSLVGGAGFQFANGVSINASYDHGLSRLDKNKNLNSYNRGFKVGIGFQF